MLFFSTNALQFKAWICQSFFTSVIKVMWYRTSGHRGPMLAPKFNVLKNQMTVKIKVLFLTMCRSIFHNITKCRGIFSCPVVSHFTTWTYSLQNQSNYGWMNNCLSSHICISGNKTLITLVVYNLTSPLNHGSKIKLKHRYRHLFHFTQASTSEQTSNARLSRLYWTTFSKFPARFVNKFATSL